MDVLKVKISELPVADTLTGNEMIEIVQGGTNKKALTGELFRAGSDGKSAYQVAVDNGFTGTEYDWLLSIRGAQGVAGKAAYISARDNGFVGTEAEWVESLKGKDGVVGTDGRDGINGTDGTNGVDGKSAYEIALEYGYVGTEAEWLASLKGADGINGSDGAKGKDGIDGVDGKSAYDIAVDTGFIGTQVEWIISLKGQQGVPGKAAYTIARDNGFVGTEAEWIASLAGKNGLDGAQGEPGVDGINGLSAYQVAIAAGFVGTEAEWLLSLQGVQGPIGPSPTIFPYDITFSAFEQIAPSMTLGAVVLARPLHLVKDLAKSQAYCDTPPISSPSRFDLSIEDADSGNVTQIGTVTFMPGNKRGIWAMAADVDIAVGQVLRCKTAAPADFDTSILGVQLTVVGTADIGGV